MKSSNETDKRAGRYVRQSTVWSLSTNSLSGFTLLLLTLALQGVTSFAEPPASVERFAQAGNEKEEKALAKRLGDEYIARKAPNGMAKGGKEDVEAFLNVRGQKEDVETFIDRQMALTASDNGEERAEANFQIHRLWWVAAPRLIDYIGDENDTINEAAMKNLILM
ncbi:MAG: hypothetical protein K8F91_06080, partial [Candidatus Obscuribacterales bacterium]|nr:hypothetical protein [Candidatus Obscuribacterales bacterium]